MYSGDDETYLRKSFDGTNSFAGSIFMEGINNPEFTDVNTIIYGHNMRNLSMFGLLKKYTRDDKYYDSNKYFQIITPNYAYRYLIFAYETLMKTAIFIRFHLIMIPILKVILIQ